ncbi:MAG TPA: hypothetical protein VGA69_07335 [Nitriliruptorales bacterium]
MSLDRVLAATLTMLAVVATSLPGCTPQDPIARPTSGDEVALRIDRLNQQMADVARSQRDATAGLRPVLEAVRELDAFVAGMRDPERIRSVEDTWPRVDAAYTSVDPTGLRASLVELAVDVDVARVTLARAREALPQTWERRYLDAEDQVLMAVRSYAEGTDALVQVLQRHWPTYGQVHAACAAFVSANEFYRTSQEAVQAYEVRVGRMLGPLAGAQGEFVRFRDAQVEAAASVNRASETAAGAWAARPSGAATP